MRYPFLFNCLMLTTVFANAQSECFTRLLNRGVEEFNKGNFKLAKLKWETAKTDCPVSNSQKQTLNDWIAKANLPITSIKDTTNSFEKVRVIIKTDTVIVEKPVEKIIYVEKPVEKIIYVDKPVEKIIYVDKPVEKIVYVDKPVEKIVYRDRPEPYHEYGKGNGQLTIFTSIADGGTLKVWIDGNYVGSIDKYYPNGSVDCDAAGTVSKILIQGSHHVVAIDQLNRKWDFYEIIKEDLCSTQRLKLKL